jgi:hypothetical protein
MLCFIICKTLCCSERKRNQTSESINILHMYNGNVKLSFCPDNASRAAVRLTTTTYLHVWKTTMCKIEKKLKSKERTEKASANPNNRNIQAQATTEIVNAALPSSVLKVVLDHRVLPTRLPTIEAFAPRSRRSPRRRAKEQTYQGISNPSSQNPRELQELRVAGDHVNSKALRI